MPLPEEARLLIKECAAERDKLRAEVEELRKAEKQWSIDDECYQKQVESMSLQIGELRTAAESLLKKAEAHCREYDAPIISEHTRARNLGQWDILRWLLEKLKSNEKRPPSIAFSYSEDGRLKHRMADGSVRDANDKCLCSVAQVNHSPSFTTISDCPVHGKKH